MTGWDHSSDPELLKPDITNWLIGNTFVWS
jgi:hypothetical protein